MSGTLPSPTGGARSAALLALALAFITCLAFRGILRNQFVNYDDPDYVTSNPRVLEGLTGDNLVWAFQTGHASNWHPLTWISHMLDVELFGLKPGAHHFSSLVFHALNSALVFLVLRRLTGSTWRSWFVAALFALHPLHVESVAWVSERKDVLSTFWLLLALRCWAGYATPAPEAILRRSLCYGAALGFFALGLMSKPMVVTLPFVLLLLDYWPLERWRADRPGSCLALSRLFAEKIPFFILSAASSVVTFLVQDRGGSVSSALTLGDRLANAVVSYARYLAKMLYPADLAVLYPHPGHWPWWTVAGAGLLLLAITAAALRMASKAPWFVIGWLWFLGMLVPVIGIVQVGLQSLADRYTYVPLVGVFIIVAWGGQHLAHLLRFSLRLQLGAAAGILAVCAGFTARQVGFWKDSEALFRRTIKVTRNNYLAHNNLGLELAAKGRVEEALRQYQRSLSINPIYVEALNNLGYTLAGQGRYAEALPYYEAALKENPAHPEVNNNYGNALSELGRVEEAIRHYETALRQRPGHPDAHNNLGIALAMKGQVEEAVPHFLISLKNKPNNANARSNLGNAYAVQQRWGPAMEQYREALRLRPDDPQTHNNLANVLLQQNQLAAAIEHYREALRLRPNNPETLRNLQIALRRQAEAAAPGSAPR